MMRISQRFYVRLYWTGKPNIRPKKGYTLSWNPHFKFCVYVIYSALPQAYDCLSNINYEATLLGTPVLMMGDAYQIQKTGYNVGTYGMAFRPDDLQEARATIHLAFDLYCDWIDKQKQEAVKSVQKAVNQLKHIQTDDQKLMQNTIRNQRAIDGFKAFHKSMKTEFVNINFPHEIPEETRKILGINAKRGGAASSQVNSGRGDSLYDILKPQWADTAYRKLPGNLNFKELCFFFARRIVLLLKKRV